MECGAELPAKENSQVFGLQGPYLLSILHRGLIALDDGKLNRRLVALVLGLKLSRVWIRGHIPGIDPEVGDVRS